MRLFIKINYIKKGKNVKTNEIVAIKMMNYGGKQSHEVK